MADPRIILKNVLVRGYTLGILLVVVFTGYTAVSYLYRSIFKPGKPPTEILAWKGETAAERLRTPGALGITEPAGRAPLAHYHAVDRWYQPDLRNGCITSGCHDPIPHSQSKELRAFANLHSTFMSCEVCHRQASATPISAVWVSTKTGKPQPAPAILQLLARFSAATQPADLADQSESVLQLLRQAIDVSGGDPVLNFLALQLETSQPGSPVWRQAIQQLAEELPNHARGEYGAKIAMADGPGIRPTSREFAKLTEEYFSRKADQADRTRILGRIHEGIIQRPQACVPCHRTENPMLDFKALGYSPSRIDALTSTPIVGMIQQIREGQPFNLPLGP
ncbi:MAG TPA: hypothetical protein PL151_01175 [Phycisphaerae bacterium]|nr:hypothetical protein [Phycisphaerae bacterium]HOJ75067.1 hypothetical protein [Phycisphaerae bacterium]HOM51938.1 hypothetical protein [Phycisphaerae bacterium]HON65812.1 hypothetical protein [Phycisphaerae bacterium]HPP28099.1 hypothetical protein [Phycisphaerae bacterium]